MCFRPVSSLPAGELLNNGQADAEGRAVVLGSSNVAANTAFYNSMGYFTVDTFLLGEDDPTWDEPPFPFDVVSGKSLLRFQQDSLISNTSRWSENRKLPLPSLRLHVPSLFEGSRQRVQCMRM